MDNAHRIFGLRAVIEAIKAGETINKIFLQKGAKGKLFVELEQLVRSNSISTSYVPIEKLDRLSKLKNHQGAVAQLSPITFVKLEDLVGKSMSKTERLPLLLLLDGVSDVRNFGAIIRTAECAGVDGIIIADKCSAPVNEDTVKTSAGAAFRVPICKVSHLKDAIYYLQGSGIKVVGATEKAEKTIYDLDFKIPTAVVVGSEDTGIAPSTRKILDETAGLPMLGEIQSLNVSVAAALFVYEVVRQRRQAT